MSAIEIWQYIIIPISASIIGGLITFLGVYITIKFQQKQNSDNTVLLNKPFLKISKQKGDETVSCDYIKESFDEDNIDFEKTKFFYIYMIQTISLKNSSNADCILKEFIIDGNSYSINDVLLLKNEIIDLVTTNNCYVKTKEPLKNIFIRADDVLGNTYYFECTFETTYEKMPLIVEYENNETLKAFSVTYKIKSVSLPKSKID